MGGHIWVKNVASGGGAEFSFCLPEGHAPIPANQTVLKSRKAPVHDMEAINVEAIPLRVLLVDDSSKSNLWLNSHHDLPGFSMLCLKRFVLASIYCAISDQLEGSTKNVASPRSRTDGSIQ